MRSTKARRTTEQIAAENLTIDHTVQRHLSKQRVNNIADNLDLDSIGVITVNRRADGTNSVVDGQHRVAALFKHDLGEWRVKCDVYHELDLDDEARLFRRLNNTRSPSLIDDFKAGLVEGDPEIVGISDILLNHGLRVGYDPRKNVRCVSVLQRLYGYSPEVLDETVAVAQSAWGDTIGAMDATVLGGIGEVLRQYNGEIDRDNLAKRLSRIPGGPDGVVSRAKTLREIRSGNLRTHASTIVLDVYNAKRTKNRVGQAT